MKELQKNELMTVNGGEVGYFAMTWTDTDNELIATFQVISTAVKVVANTGIWIWNHTFG